MDFSEKRDIPNYIGLSWVSYRYCHLGIYSILKNMGIFFGNVIGSFLKVTISPTENDAKGLLLKYDHFPDICLFGSLFDSYDGKYGHFQTIIEHTMEELSFWTLGKDSSNPKI